MTGTVKFWNKGWGFITSDGGEGDIFVHFSDIDGEEGKFKKLTQGDRVEFSVEQGEKGLQAKHVVVLEA